MLSSKLAKITTFLIYFGTLLLSVLSFFTTFSGMTIILDRPLAFIGSLGLQIVLLGIAWSLMRLRENRLTYVFAFGVAAVFSIFFSFANFDSALQDRTRKNIVRNDYSNSIRETLSEYSRNAKLGCLKGRYQVARLEQLTKLEQERGWATVVDEGSKDEYIQQIIEGARVTIKSWEENQGAPYRHGKGEGIVAGYLGSQLVQLRTNLEIIDRYAITVDSLTLCLNSERSIKEQNDLANKAWVEFPVHEIMELTATKPEMRMPPNQANYIEKPSNRQQAFMLVLNDLIQMNHLALFSLLLAIAIDFIIIIMAFAGSHIIGDVEYIFDRIKRDTNRQIRKASFEETDKLMETLNGNVEKFRKASQYGLDVSKVIWEYNEAQKRFGLDYNKIERKELTADKRTYLEEL